jgi:hypothetical protein
MFRTRRRTVITLAAVLETGILGWWLGHGAMWLFAMLAAVTLADCATGVVRRRAISDLAGVELGAVLVAVLVRSADVLLTLAVAGACAAWLIRPERQSPPRPAA